LKIAFDAEGPNASRRKTAESAAAAEVAAASIAPAITIPLPPCAAYYLLDEFNHHHMHAVIPGSTHRYASTHRVSRREGHTLSSIEARAETALRGSSGRAPLDAKVLRAEGLALSELEFEWIRQFYVQVGTPTLTRISIDTNKHTDNW
jgi:alpha-ketoglutarate-dependent dioxygenase FTO